MSEKYAQHIGGGKFASALYAEGGENRFPYVSTAEEREGFTCFCRGFRWLVEGESATGEYEYIPAPKGRNNYKVADLIWWATTHGYMARADEVLKQMGLYSAALTTRVVDGNDETFAEAFGAVCREIGLTDAEIAELKEYARTDEDADELPTEGE